jgi:hypothetical protein
VASWGEFTMVVQVTRLYGMIPCASEIEEAIRELFIDQDHDQA